MAVSNDSSAHGLHGGAESGNHGNARLIGILRDGSPRGRGSGKRPTAGPGLAPGRWFHEGSEGRPRSLRLPGDIRVANGRVFGEG